MHKMILSFVISLCAMVFGSALYAMPLLELDVDDSGQLIGAKNVTVDGLLYDVEFLDGTCANRFSGCDDLGDFTFTSAPSAELASLALLDLVLLDGPDGLFDTEPDLTRGCESGLNCFLLTPYEASLSGEVFSYAAENILTLEDGLNVFGFDRNSLDLNEFSQVTWARWSSAVSVPEPGSLSLLMLGIAGIGYRLRRSNGRN